MRKLSERARLALLTSPLLAAGWLIPIYVTTGNSLWLLPFILLFGTVLASTLWVFNIFLANKIKQNKTRYIVSFSIVFSVVFLLRFGLDRPPFIQNVGLINIPQPIVSIISALAINAVVLILMELLHLRSAYWQKAKENSDLQLHNMEAQFQALKNQLQPHFLFNALSTLKTLIKRHPDKAAQYVVQLADFLRSSLITEQKQRIRLEEDCLIAINYLHLQMTRFQDALFLDNRLPEQSSQGFVPPFTLQVLVENALKHNAFSVEMPLQIVWEQLPDGRVSVRNNRQAKVAGNETSSGIGLDNLSKRFQLLGGEAPEIRAEASFFQVLFKPLTDENSFIGR